MAEKQVAFVISRRTESVDTGLGRAEETLVNQSEVVGVHRHAAVGAASPPDVVWLAGISVGVDHRQADLAQVVRVEGHVGEGGIQGLETLGDIVRRGENAGAPDVSKLAGHVLIVVDVEASRAADGIGHTRAARGEGDGGSSSAGRRSGRGDRLCNRRRGGHIYRARQHRRGAGQGRRQDGNAYCRIHSRSRGCGGEHDGLRSGHSRDAGAGRRVVLEAGTVGGNWEQGRSR